MPESPSGAPTSSMPMAAVSSSGDGDDPGPSAIFAFLAPLRLTKNRSSPSPEQVADHGDQDRLAGLAGGEGQLAGGGLVVAARAAVPLAVP